jgi:hypothetical protein
VEENSFIHNKTRVYLLLSTLYTDLLSKQANSGKREKSASQQDSASLQSTPNAAHPGPGQRQCNATVKQQATSNKQ